MTSPERMTPAMPAFSRPSRLKPLSKLRRLALLVLLAGVALPPVPAFAVEKKPTEKKPTSTNNKPVANKPAAPAKKTATVSSAQQDLARVQKQIKASEQRIQLTREQRAQKEAELQKAEAEIGELRASVQDVQTDVQAREQRLTGLRVERSQRQADKEQQLAQIRLDLRLAQRQSGQDHYKLLLNQQDPQTLARMLKYYGYLQRARAGRVEALNTTLARLDQIEQEEREELVRLKLLRGDLEGKQTRLAVAQKTRNDAIRVLNARIESEEEKVDRLRRDQQSLQALMDRLEKAAREASERAARERAQQQKLAEEKRAQEAAGAGKPVPAAPAKPTTPAPAWQNEPDFRAVPYSGRCPLPADGGIRARFGSARSGGLRWNGIVIAAAPGSQVRAIRPGKVAYADYLRGYGYLIIVDHGRGLMSLYGQNERLLKKSGDAVVANEAIANVGGADAGEAAGLYFEIRHRGRPSDPAGWCSFQ
ncbi:MAG: peptidoglycan DD-metalloendopeptidase family protein [Moraxellaceae bacterium]|nr:peptidoglycan DD-metalloendopeptidase family protein [Moraxellaceae bacterium]